MVVRLYGTWAVLALAAGGYLHASITVVPQAEFHRTYSLNPNGRIVIQNLYGDVRITAWNRDEVMVEAVKKSSDPRQLDDARIVVDSSESQISIRTQYAGSTAEHPASVEYRIMIPRTANLEDVKLTNGGLSITGLAGSVKARAVNGSIRAEGLQGQVELSTINGRLEAEFDRVSRLNSISLSSVNGPIRLFLPARTGALVTAHNLSGGIQTDFGRALRSAGGHSLRTTMNRGGAQIRVHNVNGGISIRAHGNGRSQRPCT